MTGEGRKGALKLTEAEVFNVSCLNAKRSGGSLKGTFRGG
jgi:hypothetical protein